jgi:hypothetical protein
LIVLPVTSLQLLCMLCVLLAIPAASLLTQLLLSIGLLLQAAELEMFVANPDFEPPDRNADNQERWNQARKRIIHSNLFGPYPQAAAIDAVPVEETTRERRRRRR